MNLDILEPKLENKAHIRELSFLQNFWAPHFAELCCCQLKAVLQALLVGQMMLPTLLHVLPSWDLGGVLRLLGSMSFRPLGSRCHSPLTPISKSDSLRFSNEHSLDLMNSLGQVLLKRVLSQVTCNYVGHLPCL